MVMYILDSVSWGIQPRNDSELLPKEDTYMEFWSWIVHLPTGNKDPITVGCEV